jgi:diguanylate cyclase (GGDEF)-like protein
LVIDTKTILFALAVGYLLFGTVLAFYRGPAADSRVLRGWVWAQWAKGAGIGLLVLRDLIPLGLSQLGNVVVFGGFAIEVACYVVYAGYGPMWRRFMAAPALIVAGLGVALVLARYGWPRLYVTLFSSLAITVLSLSAGGVMLWSRNRRRSRVQIVLGLAFMVTAAAGLYRGVGILNGAELTIFSNSPYHLASYLMAYGLMIVDGFAFLLMVKEDSDRTLERLATTDELTGVLNRRAFVAATQSLRSLAQRTGQPAALIMLDVDRFKQVNDTHGHAAGDAVLRDLAGALVGHLREIDIFGRMGGEEFAIALAATPWPQALQAAERLRRVIEATPVHVEGKRLAVTMSLGITALMDGESLDAALARADAGLYAAKNGGRNQVVAVAPSSEEG